MANPFAWSNIFLQNCSNMGNSMCGGARECVLKQSDISRTKDNSATFGMLCKRPYDKEVVVKFEKIYTAPTRRKRKKKKQPR